MKIWAHTIVKNEENYVWYAIMSIIDHVDKVLIYDTGSTDKTNLIIREVIKARPGKIIFEKIGEVDIHEFTSVRQEMLKRTQADWILLADADEVWWDEGIRKVTSLIHEENMSLDTVVNRYRNLVRDIFHYQLESAGFYQIDDQRGHLTIRAMNLKIPGLKVDKPHGTQGFFNKDGVLVQELPQKRRKFIDEVTYLHFTHLPRSRKDEKVPKRKIKLKYQFGHSLPLDFYYPEVFFRPRPDIIPSPWRKSSFAFRAKARLILPLRLAKKNLLPQKSGY